MKSKDSVFYTITILLMALFLLTPVIVDNVYSHDAPVTSVFNLWLEHAENFVNTKAYSAGF